MIATLPTRHFTSKALAALLLPLLIRHFHSSLAWQGTVHRPAHDPTESKFNEKTK